MKTGKALRKQTNQKNTIIRSRKLKLLSPQFIIYLAVWWTHFLLDVPAKGKDAKLDQASMKVSEGAVGVTV